MKKLPILIFLFLMVCAFCSSMCSFRSASDRIETDINNALELTLAEMQCDVVSADTIRCYRNYLTIAELKDTACIAMRTVRRGERQETEMVAEANCDIMTVFMLSDQRASGVLLVAGILWMMGSLWYMRRFKPELLIEGMNYGGLIYGPVKQNWTDSLGYWLNSNKLMSFAREVIKTRGNRIENQDVIDAIAGWGLADENGYILIPVMHRNSNDDVDILCKSITNKLSNAIKNYCKTWYSAYNLSSERLGQIVFYHEVMWDLLEILEFKGLIAMPPILKGEEVGKQHFGDICFIVIDDSNE